MTEKLKILELLKPIPARNGILIGKLLRKFDFGYIQTYKKIILYLIMLEDLQDPLLFGKGLSNFFPALHETL